MYQKPGLRSGLFHILSLWGQNVDWHFASQVNGFYNPTKRFKISYKVAGNA